MKQTTPWGKTDFIRKYGKGIAFVATPRHGGMRVSRALAEKVIPKEQREKAAIFQNGYYWFEEDCAYSVVILNFPDRFPETMREIAQKTFQHWYVDRSTL